MRRSGKLVTVGAVALLLGAAPAATAQATAARPGGWILTLAVPHENGVGELRAVRPDGGGVIAYGRQLSWSSSPDYSPGGDRIVYIDGYSVRVMNADGTDDHWLVDGKCWPSNPRWSPDAHWIAFEACGDIYQVGAAGPDGGFVNVTNDSLNDLEPAWSPDSGWIASATLPGVHVYRAGGSVARQISDLPGAVRLDWNPDGRTLAVAADGDLWLVDVRTGAPRRLTDTPALIEADPVWSPDGRWLAFARGPRDPAVPEDPDGPQEPGSALHPRVWLMTATGAHAHPIGAPGVPTSWRAGR
jgi:TolB protein